MAVQDQLFGGLSGVDWSGGTLTFLKWFMWPVIIGLGGYAIWWLFSYNVTVNIKGNDSSKLGSRDKGRRVIDRRNKQVKGFKLLKNAKDWSGEPISESYFQPVRRMFGRVGYEVDMHRNEQGELRVISPPKSDLEAWQGIKSSDRLWAMNSLRDAVAAYATKEGKWDWVANAAPWIGLFIVVVLMLVLMRQMEGVVSGLNGVAASLEGLNVNSQVVS